jgi:hypothetical protein
MSNTEPETDASTTVPGRVNFVVCMVNSSFANHASHCLTLVNAHLLSEVIVTAEILPVSFDGTLVRCKWGSISALKSKNICETAYGVGIVHVPLQMPTASKALVTYLNVATVHRFFCTPTCTMKTGAVGHTAPT